MTKVCLKDPLIFSLITISPEGIEWFIEDKAFSPSYVLTPPLPVSRQQVVSLSQSYCMSPVVLTGGGPRGSQIIRWQESLGLYKSFKTLRIRLLNALHKCTHPSFRRKYWSKMAPYCIKNYKSNVRNIFTKKFTFVFYVLFILCCMYPSIRSVKHG
jgi:hypothetical protein